MSKYLFIAEKPSAMREFSAVYNKHASTINKHLGVDQIDFVALRGHIFKNKEPRAYDEWKDKKWSELYESYLPLIPKTWEIVPNDGSEQIIKDLKAKLKEGYDGIIVGTDVRNVC